MNSASLFFFTLTILWTLAGIFLFTYLKWETLKRKTKNVIITTKRTAKIAKTKAKSFSKDLLWAAFLLSPMLIPIAVTTLCLYFG